MLITFQYFQIKLVLRIFPVWDFIIGIFTQKTKVNVVFLLSTLICQYLHIYILRKSYRLIKTEWSAKFYTSCLNTYVYEYANCNVILI